MKDDSAWLSFCYILFAAIVAYVFHTAMFTFGLSLEESYSYYPLVRKLLSPLLAIVVTWRLQASPERRDFHLATIGELRRVLWPSLEEVKKMTFIVVCFVGIVAAILTVFDSAWSRVLQSILPK